MLTKIETQIELNALKDAKEMKSLEALFYPEQTAPLKVVYDLMNTANEADKVVCPKEKKTKDIF